MGLGSHDAVPTPPHLYSQPIRSVTPLEAQPGMVVVVVATAADVDAGTAVGVVAGTAGVLLTDTAGVVGTGAAVVLAEAALALTPVYRTELM